MSRRRTVLTTGAVAVVAVGLLSPASATAPLSAHLNRALAGADSGTFPGSQVPVGDRDNRGPRLAVLPAAQAAVDDLHGVKVSWNQYGTPLTLTRPGGLPVASGLTGTPEEMARTFLTAHAGLLGMGAADVAALERLPNGDHSDTTIHTEMFRQSFGGLPLAEDGLVAVTVKDDKVWAVTSSAVPPALLGTSISTVAVRTPTDAVLAAAHEVGVSTMVPSDLTLLKGIDLAGLYHVKAAGMAQDQLARLRILPTTNQGARLVWETVVEDVSGGLALAVTSDVDDRTGDVLLRRDDVDTLAAGTATTAATRAVNLNIGSLADTGGLTVLRAATGTGAPIQGSYTDGECSAALPLTVDAGTRTIAVEAAVTSANVADDIVINVFVNGMNVGTEDNNTQPEAGAVLLTTPTTDADVVTAKVCPFAATDTTATTFVFDYSYNDTAADVPTLPDLTVGDPTLLGPGTYTAFASNPALGKPSSAADRYVLCNILPGATAAASSSKDLSVCGRYTGVESPNGYDTLLGNPTMTTSGNNALTSNAQASTSLTPGPPATPATGVGRDYAPDFTDSWQSSTCDPTTIADPTNQADINASIVNLFTGHNRIHDFAYRLGLTEPAGALQVDNFGKDGAPGDVELGNAQNAALTNPTFTVTNGATTPTAGVGLAGRNNANQITMMDGVPGITNQYLFEPVVGFYGPCADGDLDSSVFLHEYTHAISNRLIAGPDTGLSGQQGGSMGESWSDLDALEFLNAFGVAGAKGEDPFSLGAYATGNTFIGIRDFNSAPQNTPLTYAQFGFDTTGPEVHADGEVWNAANIEVRQRLVAKYDAMGLSSTDLTLQRECALGVDDNGASVFPDGFTGCPGNRRWITYMYDSLIMQANGAPSMVDMKDLEIVSAAMHATTGRNDVDDVTAAFAKRGLGAGSSSVDGDDLNPVPAYDTGVAAEDADVTFNLVDSVTGKPVAGRVVVGTFEARARAVATTLGGTMPDASAPIVGGIAHQFVVQAAGYGLQRFTETFVAGKAVTQTFSLKPNIASKTAGGEDHR